MISHIRLTLLAGLVALCLADPSLAQSPQVSGGGAATVALPGCTSDVPIAATRVIISFTSDGRDVHALLYEPEGVPSAGSALVIMHGRAVEEDLLILDNHAVQLASRGFAVILPFYLEAERDRAEPAQARAAHRIWREVALDAAEAVAFEMGFEPRQVVLWGHTRGGGIALAAALKPGSPVGGAIGVNIGGAPQDDAQGASRPFLLIHPAHSRILPPRTVREMAEKIQERGGEVERIEIAHEYGEFEPADWCRVMDSTRGLLERVASSGSSVTPAN